MSKAYDYLFKLLLVGDAAVGKTALVNRFSAPQEKFVSNFVATISVDIRIRTVDIEGKKIKLQIWDIPCRERFQASNTMYYRGAQGVFLVYDITRRETLDTANMYFHNIREHAPEDVQIMLVGTHCEMQYQREVSTKLGAKLAMVHEIKFMEVSAKYNINVEDALITLARDIMTATQQKEEDAAQFRMSKETSGRKCNIL